MTSNSTPQYQEHLGAFSETESTQTRPQTPFQEPPIPPNQDEIELLNPIDTLETLRNPQGDIRKWLTYIRDQYTPPSETEILLLYPCAAKKPMPSSKTYRSLSKTLNQYNREHQQKIHVVTVSEPMGLVPFEYQNSDNPTWLYDTPGLFRWWVKENDHEWNSAAQQQALHILGEHIAGFLKRTKENNWYDTHIACVRHTTAKGNESQDQTHRQMLKTAQSLSEIKLTWLPSKDVVLTLTDEVGPMAWQFQGVSHDVVQAELTDHLDAAFGMISDPENQH